MNHLLLTDDPFFSNYTTFGFNVMVVKEEDVLGIIQGSSVTLIMITEGLWDTISADLDPKGNVAVVPIPDRKNKGAIARNSVERMLSAIVGRL